MLMLPMIGIKGESRWVCLQEHREKLSQAPVDVASSDLLNSLGAQSVSLRLSGLSWESYQPVHKSQPKFAGPNFSSSEFGGNLLFLQSLWFELGAVGPCGQMELGAGMGKPLSLEPAKLNRLWLPLSWSDFLVPAQSQTPFEAFP